MKLDGKLLKRNMKGQDVELLHRELKNLAVKLPKRTVAGKTFDNKTEKAVKTFQQDNGLDPTGIVDEATITAINAAVEERLPYAVHGVVREADGTPIEGAEVSVTEQYLREKGKDLGSTMTIAKGEYLIRCPLGEGAGTKKQVGSLLVQAESKDERGEKRKVESAILFRVKGDERVDLTFPPAADTRSEWEKLTDTVTKALEGQGVQPHELIDKDLDFLSSNTGQDRERIRLWSLAIKVAKAEQIFELEARFLYAWFREGLPTEWEALRAQRIDALRNALVAAIDKQIVPAADRDAVEAVLLRIPNPEWKALQGVVTKAGFAADKAATVLKRADGIDAVTDRALRQLTEENVLSRKEADLLGLTVSLHRLTGGHEGLTSQVPKTKFASLGDAAPTRTRDLAALDSAEWEAMLAKGNVDPPSGLTRAQHATRLADQLAEGFPTDALLSRTTKVTDKIANAVKRVVSNSDGLPSGNGDSRVVRDTELQSFINLHPGLELGKAVEAAGTPDEAISTIKERVGWMDQVRRLNPDLDLLSIDYLPDSESVKQVKFDGLPGEARDMVVANFKAYQRMQTVTGQTSGSITLLKSGYRSANALARSQPEEISKKTGMPLDEARAYHAQAEHKAGEASLAWFAFFGSERDSRTFTSLPLPEIPPSLKKIAGYAELFGSLDFCHCEKCQSVLGAGAYFVDLMFFVEQYILTKSFADHGEEQNGLHLRRRRPDLWSLPLTCDNTNRVVPSLTLVIDILEQFLLRAEGVPTVAQLYNERLETADHSIRLPFSLPLERLSVWLGHLGIRRSEIAHAFLRRDQDPQDQRRDRDPQMVRARIRLGMIPEQFRLITTSRLGDSSQENVDVASEFFSRWLGITVRLSPSTLAETEVLTLTNVLVFTRASGLNRAVVNTILSTDFVNGDAGRGVDPIEVKSGIATDGNVQNDSEWVKNLTGGRLDRFERFVRLWRHVPWTVEELDYVLDRMRKRGVAMESGRFTEDQAAVLGLAQLLDIQEQFQLPVDVLCALWDELPQVVLQGERSLFDRLFNAEPWAGVNQKWDNPRLRIETSPDAQARLCAGLQVDSVELGVLLRGLDACLQRVDGIPPDPPTIVSPLDKNLSLLYRHARLARLRKLSVEELMQTLALVPSIQARSENKRCVLELQDLRELLETHDWRVASGFTLKEIAFITQTGQTLPGYENAIDLATRIVQEIRTESLLHLSSEVFTQLGLSQADSDRIVRENSTPEDGGQPLLEPVPGESTFRISRGIAVDDVSTELKFNETPNAVRIAEVARDLYRIIKGAGENGFQATDLAQLGLSEKQADALIKANVFVPGNDDKPFEQAPLDGVRYRLRKTVTEAEAIARFGRDQEDQVAVARILKRRAVDLLIRYHADAVLAAKASIAAKVSPEKARALLNLVKPRDAMRTSLVDTLQGGPIEVLTNTLHRLLQCALLFRGQIFDAQTLEFVRQNQSAFAFAEPFTSESVRRTSLYQKLATGSDPAYQPDALTIDLPALQAVVAQRGSIKKDPRVQSQLGRALRTDEVLVKEVLAKIEPAAGASRLDELSQLREALDLTRRLGIPAEIVRFAVSEDPDELTRGADGVFAAIRGKYPDEKKFIEAIEPFEDKLRSRNRDGLVGYLLHAPSMRRNGQQRFASPNDLYHYFLTDVMVEGCARTSRVVAAISSLQLYVHRVLMNLEESDADDPTVPVVTVRLDEDKKAEWRWRKNYQVWVANRKVFLYPENYIEPGLRDQKTPLFKELEDTLLQQQITEQNVLDAYATYLRGFEEVARLSIAGAYRDRTGRDDLLHLFGVTPSDPPVYYYRTVRNLDNANGPVVSAWEKVDAQIPVRKVSPIVYLNRLCLFWVETTTRPLNEFKDGDSVFLGYRHSVRSKFSQLRLDGRWTPSQTLRFLDTTGVVSESKTIDETVEMTLMHTRVRSFIAIFTPGVPGYTVPNPLPAYLYGPLQLGPTEPLKDFEVVRGRVQWDRLGRNHAKPIEGYSPKAGSGIGCIHKSRERMALILSYFSSLGPLSLLIIMSF